MFQLHWLTNLQQQKLPPLIKWKWIKGTKAVIDSHELEAREQSTACVGRSRHGEAIHFVARFIDSRELEARAQSTVCVGRSRHEEAIHFIARFIDSRELEARAQSTFCVRRSRHEEAIHFIARFIDSRELEARAQWTVCVGRSRHEEAIHFIARFIDSRELESRDQSTVCVGRSRHEEIIHHASYLPCCVTVHTIMLVNLPQHTVVYCSATVLLNWKLRHDNAPCHGAMVVLQPKFNMIRPGSTRLFIVSTNEKDIGSTPSRRFWRQRQSGPLTSERHAELSLSVEDECYLKLLITRHVQKPESSPSKLDQSEVSVLKTVDAVASLAKNVDRISRQVRNSDLIRYLVAKGKAPQIPDVNQHNRHLRGLTPTLNPNDKLESNRPNNQLWFKHMTHTLYTVTLIFCCVIVTTTLATLLCHGTHHRASTPSSTQGRLLYFSATDLLCHPHNHANHLAALPLCHGTLSGSKRSTK
ncbi:hypothetical protein J6590_040521 [Homalodisca vitripennis]|nr:hypothetical protein J6590_040521 [Homalodisca vitripennis]